MKSILYFLLSVGLFTACSEPKYIQPVTSPNNSGAQESKTTCEIKFQKSDLCFSWRWEQIPTASTAGILILKTFRLNLFDQTPVEIDSTYPISLILWMPSMGHGSSPTQTQRLDIGTYRISNVFFIMPGEWEMKFQIKNEIEIIDETILQITI